MHYAIVECFITFHKKILCIIFIFFYYEIKHYSITISILSLCLYFFHNIYYMIFKLFFYHFTTKPYKKLKSRNTVKKYCKKI